MAFGKQRIKEFFSPALEFKWLVVQSIIISSTIAFVEIYTVNILKDITDLVAQNKYDELIRLSYMLIGILTVFYIFTWFTRRFEAIFYRDPRKIIYKRVIEKFIRLDNNITETTWTWKFISILQNWITTWSDMFQYIFRSGIESFVKILVWFYFIYLILPNYFLYFLFLFFIILLVIYIWNCWAIKWRILRREAKSKQIHQLVKIIMSKFEILQNWKSSKEIWILQKLTDEEKEMDLKVYDWLWLMFIIPRVFIDFLKILVIFIVWIWVIKKIFSIWDFVALSWILILLERAINSLTDFYKNFTKNFIDIEKLFDVLEEIPTIKWYDIWEDFECKKWEIELRNLSFSYWNEKVFEDFNLKIRWWVKVALVWISWSGKTTLAKLISWYLYPDWWSVEVDWQNLEKINLKSYYKHIWYLTQDPWVLDASIMDNLTYGLNRDISEDEVRKVLALAECDFVENFEQGLKTEIWERWIRLSWWQKQRIAIAKLFLKNPEIIILDEPTSALDSFSEDKITKAFQKLFEHRTVIIIAHRLQTVKEADDIIVLEDSRIIERWNHETLIQKKWIYSKMLDMQWWKFIG
ncbi:MAG: hypothetical protein ACD_3C00025G0005 [uncultured bacterium (gcode 4)]|uniref:ABC transporter domain-containing protein n=1 Tax=uncultured bacterium (gcode 4) TaxID=1234023 RepID=K2FCE2_9BACT|nr:MAG: hypothetical protein ACD_3C00025G0005 [uncultured bacterium (gcode 4)]